MLKKGSRFKKEQLMEAFEEMKSDLSHPLTDDSELGISKESVPYMKMLFSSAPRYRLEAQRDENM